MAGHVPGAGAHAGPRRPGDARAHRPDDPASAWRAGRTRRRDRARPAGGGLRAADAESARVAAGRVAARDRAGGRDVSAARPGARQGCDPLGRPLRLQQQRHQDRAAPPRLPRLASEPPGARLLEDQVRHRVPQPGAVRAGGPLPGAAHRVRPPRAARRHARDDARAQGRRDRLHHRRRVGRDGPCRRAAPRWPAFRRCRRAAPRGLDRRGAAAGVLGARSRPRTAHGRRAADRAGDGRHGGAAMRPRRRRVPASPRALGAAVSRSVARLEGMAPGMMAASHVARGIEAGMAHLAAIIAADGGALPMPGAAADALAAAADGWRPPPAPIGMIATPCSQPAARWHLDQLSATTAHDAARRAKRLLHARLLGHLLSPDDPRFRPPVTILIPVYNRAALCVEAVESCLAQSWRPLEILVVDDGSTDDLASALRPYGDAVRLLRKPNGGVSSARNAGIAAARGDFIHFLDSDNLLLPDAVAAKVAAFITVADAELCYGVGLLRSRHGRTKFSTHVADGSPLCPTHDLMAAVARQYPFWVSTVMLARWTAWDGLGFEEDLRSAEDLRYWTALAFRGTKAIGFWRPLMVRRMFPQSLGGRTSPFPDARVTARLRNLRDALMSQRHWRHAGGFYRQMLYRHAVDPIIDEPTALVQRTMDELRS